jgi:hypothetical protein
MVMTMKRYSSISQTLLTIANIHQKDRLAAIPKRYNLISPGIGPLMCSLLGE